MWAMLRLCYARATYGPNYEAIQMIGMRDWKRATWRLLKDIPSPDTLLSEWGAVVRRVLEQFLTSTRWPCAISLASTFRRCNASSASVSVAHFVDIARVTQRIPCMTIHKAKGMTFEAVLVVSSPRTRRRRSGIEQWLAPRGGEEEERRVGYVAMTRPRKLLVVAVPEDVSVDALTDSFEVDRIRKA